MTLGHAGLLPAFVAACGIAVGQIDAALLALGYPLLILSFLGGVWWGFAMRRPQRQGRLAAMAVAPSLVALAIVGLGIVTLSIPAALAWLLIATGAAVLLTLPVDRHLVRTGEAPAGWMRLRVPLSVGLGGLTIVSGTLLGRG